MVDLYVAATLLRLRLPITSAKILNNLIWTFILLVYEGQNTHLTAYTINVNILLLSLNGVSSNSGTSQHQINKVYNF